MDKRIVPDGYGGTKIEYSDGTTINVAIDIPDSELAKIADKLTERANCNVITRKGVTLTVNDIIRRKRDGMYLKILMNSADRKTPNSANLNARVARAEIMQSLPESE